MSKRKGTNLKGKFFVISGILLTNYFHYGWGLGIIKSGLLGFTSAAILLLVALCVIRKVFGK
ncbi:MAG: hypothetical protein MRERV_1c173 [Mycoplasmataceae bacterium RV_VA103A]|nr:MAG: hypothetical protein MRERV_1c173 [Mycoplasmataceae bacterium RV_VA103A]